MDDKVENGQHIALEQLLEDIKVVLRDGQELLRVGMSNVRQRARTGEGPFGRTALCRVPVQTRSGPGRRGAGPGRWSRTSTPYE